ncbi:unnamed protein product [Parnassius apollo]|uniref:(apollo) hypothetical protein n=1 Tax=Parnassius apollo TaxID=110799 RepID=A0A8S3XZZ4_PARAO|nr:unnamed protein product [Parnassius apollo]
MPKLQCKKCKQFLPNTKEDSVECKKCKHAFHRKCVKDISCFSAKGICDTCEEVKTGGGTPRSPTTKDNEVVLEQINERMAIVEGMSKKLEEINLQLKYYAEKYKETLDFKKEATEKFTKHENQIKDLQQRNIHLEKRNKMMEERICVFENREREKNIELNGVKYKEKENILEIVRKISHMMGVEDDIESAWRVGREKNNGKPRPVFVRLRS